MPNLSPAPRRDRGRLLAALAVAAVLHALVLVRLRQPGPSVRPPPQAVAAHPPLALLPPRVGPAQRRAVQQARAARMAKEPAPRREALPKGQIVELPPSADQTPPETARYLSEANTKVARETRARHTESNPHHVLAQSQRGSPGPTVVPAPKAGPPRPPRARPRQAADEPPAPRLALHLDPGLGRLMQRPPPPASKAGPQAAEEDPAPAPPPRMPANPLVGGGLGALMPNLGTIAHLDGGPRNDALPEVDLGEGTYLNSREFRHASFFNRLHRAISAVWRPQPLLRDRDPSGEAFGAGVRITVVAICLDKDGGLKEARVVRSCGLSMLDDEAAAAVARAAPFPHPPAALLDDADEIRFPFGFHVRIGPPEPPRRLTQAGFVP